jgi:hypothetical protein
MILEVQRHLGREDARLSARPGARRRPDDEWKRAPCATSARTAGGSVHRDLADRPSGAFFDCGSAWAVYR